MLNKKITDLHSVYQLIALKDLREFKNTGKILLMIETRRQYLIAK